MGMKWHATFFGWLNRRLSARYRHYPRLDRSNMFAASGAFLAVYPYADPETIHYTRPHHLGDLPHPHRDQLGTVTYPQPVVLDVHGGTLRGRHGAVFTRDERLVFESLIHREAYIAKTSFGRVHYPRSLRQFAQQLVVAPHYDTICPIINVYSQGYFHWVTEVLPRLWLLAMHQAATGQTIPILIDPDPPQWVQDSLRFLGFSDYVEWRATHATADHLIVPMALYTSGVPSARAVRWVSERVKANLPAETRTFDAPRIYITRKQARLRRVVNEDDVIRWLDKWDFQVFALETLTFAEQVSLFSQAEWVIGPHGAGFANLIHSHKPAMIEFFEPGYINPCFYRLACGMSFDYGCLVGESRGKDIFVDVDDLEQLTAQMGR